MSKKARRKARRRRYRNVRIVCVAVLAVAVIAAWGVYFRDSVRIADHVPAGCALMLAANDLWPGVRELPQWDYAVESCGESVAWLAAADALSDTKKTLLMCLVCEEVRVVMCSEGGSDASAICLVKLSRLGKLSDLLARLSRRVRVESLGDVKLRRVNRGRPFYYTVLGRLLIGGESPDRVVEAATLSGDKKFVESNGFAQMERRDKVPWLAFYRDLGTETTGEQAGAFKSAYGVVHVEKDGIQAEFEAPFAPEFRKSASDVIGKMQRRTVRTSTRMPADVIAGLTVCGSAPFGEILESAAQAFELPRLRPDSWDSIITGRGSTLAASCGALFAEFVDALSNEATLALTNVEVDEIVPTPEFIFFGKAREGMQEDLLEKLEQTAERGGDGPYGLQKKRVKGVDTAYIDLPEGRALQLCFAGIGDLFAVTTSEYALESFLDTALGNTPSIKMAEPDLIEPEEGANLVLVLNTQRLAEESEELLELLLEYDLLVDVDREKYDTRISPVLGLGRLFRPVGVSVSLGSDCITGDVKVPFAKM